MQLYTAATIAAGKWAREHLRDTMKTTELAQLAESLPLSKQSSNPGEENTEKTRCGHDRSVAIVNCMVAVVVCADARVRGGCRKVSCVERRRAMEDLRAEGAEHIPAVVRIRGSGPVEDAGLTMVESGAGLEVGRARARVPDQGDPDASEHGQVQRTAR